LRRLRRFRLRWRRDVAAAAGSMLTAEEILLHHLLAVRKSVTSCLARARRLRLAGEKRVVQRQQRRGQGADVVGRGLGGRFGSSDQKEESESDSGSGSGGDDAADVPTSVRHRAFLSLATRALFLFSSSLQSSAAKQTRADAERGRRRVESVWKRENEREFFSFFFFRSEEDDRKANEESRNLILSMSHFSLSFYTLRFFIFKTTKTKKSTKQQRRGPEDLVLLLLRCRQGRENRGRRGGSGGS
jgi:hypothetical protein